MNAPNNTHVIQPTPEARQRLVDYHNVIVERRKVDLRDVTGFAARWCENAWRLALVLHAGFHGVEAHEHRLELATAANAVRIAEWFANQQLEILSKVRFAAAKEIEDQVLKLIHQRTEREKINFITARDVHRARIVPTPEAARALLDRMERDGLLVSEEVRPEKGGRTVKIFRAVNNPVSG